MKRNRPTRWIFAALAAASLATAPPAPAQENSAEDAKLRSAALASLPKDAARRAFGVVTSSLPGKTEIEGEYWKGCYSGGVMLPPVGEHWQVMRLYRNRNWGTPHLIDFLKRFSAKAAEVTGWPGILIGDMSQPRGGPMLTGHSSHQLGIEADIWLRPMPERRFTPEENGTVRSTDLLRADRKDVDPKVYTRKHFEVLRAAASQPEVARVFVNAAIKKALCRDAGADRGWLSKIRPAAGHSYHFHIRLKCPKGQDDCEDQTPPLDGDGCGKELDYWFRPGVVSPTPGKTGRVLSLAAMPEDCREIVAKAVPASPPEMHSGVHPEVHTGQNPEVD